LLIPSGFSSVGRNGSLEFPGAAPSFSGFAGSGAGGGLPCRPPSDHTHLRAHWIARNTTSRDSPGDERRSADDASGFSTFWRPSGKWNTAGASSTQQPLSLLAVELKPSRVFAESGEIETALRDVGKNALRMLRSEDSIFMVARESSGSFSRDQTLATLTSCVSA